jgi:hypothetical protein
MTSLDLILKNMILSAPYLYPTTWQCYASIFLDVNSGFTFTNSEIQCPFEVKENPVINERYLELYKTLAVTEIGELDYGMKLFMNDFIKENIDVIVSTKCVYVEYLKPSIDDLALCVDESPVWLIDDSYPNDVFKAAIDVLEKVKHLLWYHYGLHHCLTRPIECASWQEVCYHTAYVKVSERLETLKPQRIPA